MKTKQPDMATTDTREVSDLLSVVDQIDLLMKELHTPIFQSTIKQLKNAATQTGKSWSGSWLGHHSLIYYDNFLAPPAGAQFSIEWGTLDSYSIKGTTGDWLERKYDDVVEYIYLIAGNPNINEPKKIYEKLKRQFEDCKSNIISILTTIKPSNRDKFLDDLNSKVAKVEIHSVDQIIYAHQPKGQQVSRDTDALYKGFKTPPHIAVLAEAISFEQPFDAMYALSTIAKQAALHLRRVGQSMRGNKSEGSSVFIGHGNSPIWKDLKDFLKDRLKLTWDEFNRVPVAGVSNEARLSEMLDSAAVAFLIMTGEDEQTDGKYHPRMNVVHEVGLFQGRLGFKKAIVLLEEGCEEFSNIDGLGQIRFPKGNIKAVFEDIREVLERECIV